MWLWLFVLLLFPHRVLAQWELITLPNQRQMPVGNVHQVMQDRSGYIWYATDGGGLCRDNGYQIDVLREGLPSLQLSQIAEDTAGNIWVGTLNGLCRIDRKEQFRIHRFTEEPFSSEVINAIVGTRIGDVWVASGKVVVRFDVRGQCLGTYRNRNVNNSGKWVNSFYEDSKGRLWVLESRNGLSRYVAEADTFMRMPWNGSDPIEMVEDTLHDCYWICTWDRGIIRYDMAIADGRLSDGTLFVATPPFNSLDICLSEDGHTLFTTDMSSLRQWHILPDGTLEEDTAIRNQLPPGINILDKLNLDREGNIWVASYMPHTFILSQTRSQEAVSTLPELNRQMLLQTGMRLLPHNIIADGDDLWLWQGRVGLVNYSPAYGVQQCPGIRGPHHLSRMEKCVEQGGVWLAQGAGLYHAWREGAELRLEEIVRMPDNEEVFSIFETADGFLWIGTERSVFRYELRERRAERVAHTGSAVLFLVTDASGSPHWLTEDMMSAYTALGRGADGTLWWGDSDGYIYRQGRNDAAPRVAYCAAAGETINRICCDSRGHVWALSDQTLSEYNPQTSAQRVFSATDKRWGVDFFRSICVVEDSVFVGCAGNVLCMVSSVALDHPSEVRPPVVSTILCDNTLQMPASSSVDISYATRVVEVRMTTLDIPYAGNIRFAYRIRELSDEWVTLPIGQNTLRLLLPSAGKYTLEAKATDRFGVWSNPDVLLVLHKLPAWWQTRWAYTMYALAGLLFLWLLVRRLIARQKKLHEQQMQEKLTELKFRFFTNVSHELRTPLSLIITPLDSMIRKGGNDALQPILRQAEHLLDLINRLLDFRKMETGNEHLQPRTGNLTEFIRMEADAFRPLAESKHLSLHVEVPEKDVCCSFDHEKMHHILSNLISNAVKYNRRDGDVYVKVDVQNDRTLLLAVRDTGIGIPKADLAHIFDRFYQAGNRANETGTGIGLNMTYEFVRLHGGELTVESVEGEGSTFTMKLPLCAMQVEDTLPSVNEPEESGGVLLLLVEDNMAFRELLAGELKAEGYRVLMAADGVEALEKLQSHPNVDIIISDIMMPRMNGVELCNKLKTDIKTSHIPVILLTARTGDENVLEGYDAGADLYLTKPFSIAILQNRIRHLLVQGQKRHQIFLQSVELKSEDLAGNDLDRRFITRAVELVEANMTNTEYSVETFAGDLHTDRTNLYRKLQTLTGQKPTEFIRTIRLKRAAQLLQSSNYSISEIADLCGFSTPSYFTSCFKKMFGKTPGDYQKENK